MTETHPIGTGERLKRLEDALRTIASQACCYGMRANETELRDWLRFISDTAEATLRKDEDERA